MRSSQNLVERRDRPAVDALPMATSAVIGPAPSIRSRCSRKPESSTMAMLTAHLFLVASALQAAIIFWTSADVRHGLVRMDIPPPWAGSVRHSGVGLAHPGDQAQIRSSIFGGGASPH